MLTTLFKKIKAPKVYSSASIDSASTLIHYEDWSSSGPIKYEVIAKNISDTSTLILERKSGHSVKKLKFKRKNNEAYLINDKDNTLASISKRLHTSEIKWEIRLNENSHWEKKNYSKFTIGTKDGKNFKVTWNYHGQPQVLDLKISKSAVKDWSLISESNGMKIASFQFDNFSLKKLGNITIIENVELPEPVILAIFGTAITQSELTKSSLTSSTISISI